jgi:3-hydroxyisobutyrate dehydrogenase
MDHWKVLESVESGAAASWSLSQLGRRILNKDFAPGFFVDHFIKDMGLALDEAKKMNLCLPGLALAHQLYVALKAQGGGLKGTQALYLALSHLSQLS